MGSKIPPATISPIETPFFRDALAVWAKIGVLSFGGPAGQIALTHRILVEERRWIAEDRFLHALNFCMLLPGPEAMQLATYVGWLLHGTLGGLAAGLLFVLPGAFRRAGFKHRLRPFRPCAACRGGVYWHQGRRSRDRHRVPAQGGPARAAAPLRLGNRRSGVCGYLLLRGAISFGHRQRRAVGLSPCGHASRGSVASASRSRFRAALGNLAHREPVACALDRSAAPGHFRIRARPRHHRHLPLFSKLAIVTFGGAYSVLAYVAQQAVETYGWLKPGEMLDGLGLAETTPRARSFS